MLHDHFILGLVIAFCAFSPGYEFGSAPDCLKGLDRLRNDLFCTEGNIKVHLLAESVSKKCPSYAFDAMILAHLLQIVYDIDFSWLASIVYCCIFYYHHCY